MTHPGGRIAIGLGGIALVAVAGFLAREALTQDFMKHLDLSGTPRARSVVAKLGLIGGTARAGVFALAGVLLLVAAVRFTPADAQSIDGTLRAFTRTPLGAWLLVTVAVGLITFGVFSFGPEVWAASVYGRQTTPRGSRLHRAPPTPLAHTGLDRRPQRGVRGGDRCPRAPRPDH